MNEPVLSHRADGTVVVDWIAPALAEAICELPALLSDDQPDDVRRRLFPDPCDDEEKRAEWRRTMAPELFALLASAREIVTSDLAGLRRAEAPYESYTLTIPAAHVNAWISALQTARLALGARHGVDEDDMDGEGSLPDDERGAAIVRIHLLAWLQGLLVDDVSPSPPDAERGAS